MNVIEVYTSPFLRAVRTAVEMFKESETPPKKIIADPRLRESFHQNYDCPKKTCELVKDFPNVDFNFLNKFPKYPELWYLDMLRNQELNDLILPHLEPGKKLENAEIMCNIIQKYGREAYSQGGKSIARVTEQRQKKEIMQLKKFLKDRCKKMKVGEKIAIVAHE